VQVQNEVPVGAEMTVQSVRWVIQSRADENDKWHNENDNTPGLPGAFEDASRKLLKIYRNMHPERESRRVRRTVACFDEPMED
jgi:hypothetical protein